MSYSRHDRFLARRSIVLLSIMPALTVLAALTGTWHQALWVDVTINPASNVPVYQHGWFFWVFIAYTYCLLTVGTLSLFGSALRSARSYRSQFVAVLLAVLFPLAGNVVYLFIPVDLSGYDFTPVGFMATGMILTWGMLRSHVLDLVPVARDRLVDMMRDGVIMIDGRGRVGDLNPAMEEVLGVSAKAVIGLPVERALSSYPILTRLLLDLPQASNEFHLIRPSGERYFDMQYSRLQTAGSGEPAGRIIVMRDITERKRLEEERSSLIGELQQALAEVKTLSGLLPVCANCKSIRDDRGYWHNVEAYLSDHSEAMLTHSICPDCMRKLYPGYADSIIDDLSDDGE